MHTIGIAAIAIVAFMIVMSVGRRLVKGLSGKQDQQQISSSAAVSSTGYTPTGANIYARPAKFSLPVSQRSISKLS